MHGVHDEQPAIPSALCGDSYALPISRDSRRRLNAHNGVVVVIHGYEIGVSLVEINEMGVVSGRESCMRSPHPAH